jgi:hypothetical protein
MADKKRLEIFAIIGFADFVQRPEFEIQENTTYWKLKLQV